MDKVIRLHILEKLHLVGQQLSQMVKEVSSTPVQGAELVREDLEGGKKKHMIHGQKQSQPLNTNKITPPAGMGIHSDSPNVDSFYQEGANG